MPYTLSKATNIFQNLDDASLHRFDMGIKFYFKKTDATWQMFIKTCSILGLTYPQQAQKIRLASLVQLMPGDFEQVVRCARLMRPESANEVLVQLEEALLQKKTCVSHPMGFLAAA